MESDARIKALTTLIHSLQPQNGPPTPGNSQSADARAYNHVATLLTRGVEDARSVIAVTGTGAHTAKGPAVTVVSSDPVPSSPPLDSALTQAHMAVTPCKGVVSGFQRESVVPNPMSLEKICETLKVDKAVTLSEHAADVLKALVSTQGHRVASAEYRRLFSLSLKLILRRCFPEIRHRVRCAEHLFGKNLIPRLRSWAPEPSDTLPVSLICHSRLLLSGQSPEDMWVKIPDVPKQFRNNVFYYQLHIDTASNWLKCLAQTIHALQNVVEKYRDGNRISYYDLGSSLDALYVYLYDLHDFLRVVLAVPSLTELLHSLRPPPRFGDPEDDDVQAEFILEPEETSSRLLLRYLQTIVAWIHAVKSLNRSKLFRSGLGFTLNIIRTPSSPSKNRMVPIQDILDELLPHVTPIETRSAIRNDLLARFKSSTSDISSATVHREAILMSLTAACSARSLNPSIPAEFVELLEQSNRVVGVGKKCCWVCNRLAQKLEIAHLSFLLPGTTGVIFPWAPPDGLALNILHELDTELTTMLTNILRKYVKSLVDVSTPSSSYDGHTDTEHMPVVDQLVDTPSGELEASDSIWYARND